MKEILLTSSVLILALIALRQLLGKHVSKGFQYALWGLVLLRLLIPVQFGSLSFSITSLTQDSEPIAVIEHQLSQPMVRQDYDHIYQRFEQQYENQDYNVTSPEVVTQITRETEEFMDLPTWGEILKFLWLAGIAAMAVWFLLVNLRFHRSARKNAERLRVESPIPVYVSDGVASPCLTGFFRPTIYLTPACAEDERLRRHVLTHELTHYRHGDHIWSVLRSLCLCIYWFDPLVWLAAILSRRDCELACDEGALKRLGEHERLSYGRSLVDVVAGDISPKHLMEAATAMNESKRQITERVNRIVKKPKYYLISTVCLLLATALIAGCAFAGSTPPTEPLEGTVPDTSAPETTETVEAASPTDENIPDTTAEDIPEPTGAQPVPETYTAGTLVTTWKEVHLEWENGAGSQEHFDARIPTIYPFSNDAIATNDRIIQKYGAILEENETAAKEGHSAYPVSIDYKAYTTAKTLSLVITTDTGHDYIDYEIYNFYLESGEFAQTMDTAAMAKYFLDMSYPEFLWAAKDFTLEYFNTEYADMSEAMREEFNTMHIDLHGMPMGDNPFYLHAFDLFVNENGQIMLRFNAYSMAGADSYPTLAPFFPGSTDKAESYRWLFNIHADGAYATAHDNIFTDAFLADPEEFSHYVSLESEEVIARVAGGIGFEGGVVYADAIREALASLPDSNFKTLTLEKLNEYWPEP